MNVLLNVVDKKILEHIVPMMMVNVEMGPGGKRHVLNGKVRVQVHKHGIVVIVKLVYFDI